MYDCGDSNTHGGRHRRAALTLVRAGIGTGGRSCLAIQRQRHPYSCPAREKGFQLNDDSGTCERLLGTAALYVAWLTAHVARHKSSLPPMWMVNGQRIHVFGQRSILSWSTVNAGSTPTAAAWRWVTPSAPAGRASWSHCSTCCGSRGGASAAPPYATAAAGPRRWWWRG